MSVLRKDLLEKRLKGHNPFRAEDPDAARAAVSVVLLPQAGPDYEIVLMRRAEREEDPWSGQVSLPGGHRDPGDESLEDTAARETLEEIGVRVPRPALARLDDVHPKSPVLPAIIVTPFVFLLEKPQRARVGPEATIPIHAALSELASGAGVATVNGRGNLLTVFGYRVGPHFIWGMTERVLTPLLKLLQYK